MKDKIKKIVNRTYLSDKEKERLTNSLFDLLVVVKSLPTEKEVRNNGHFKRVAKPKTLKELQFNFSQLERRDGALWMLKELTD